MKKTFYAVHGIEVVPCHLVAKKDRTNGQKYAANSKRDKRRFQSAYAEAEDAHREAKENEIKNQCHD